MRVCRPFHQLPSPAVQLFLTEGRGWGVKAAQPIHHSSFIVEFVGQSANSGRCWRVALEICRVSTPLSLTPHECT